MPSLFDIFSLAQYLLCLGISLFALNVLSYLLYCQSKYRERLISIPIYINIVTWIVTSTFNLCYVSCSIYSWLNGSVSPTILFWFGGTFLSASSAVSISVFFLLLDRCLILIGPSWLNDKKHLLHQLNVIFVVADFLLVLGLCVVLEKPNVSETTCQSFSCVASNNAFMFYCIRLFCGSLNMIVASMFAYLLYRYNKKRDLEIKPQYVAKSPMKKSAASKSNMIAGINVVSQIAFNFLPNLASFLALEVFGFALSSVAGPLVSTLTQVDALCTSIVYLVIVGARVIKGKTFTSTVGPTTAVQKR